MRLPRLRVTRESQSRRYPLYDCLGRRRRRRHREPKQIASSSGGDASRQFGPAAINDAAVFTRILGISDDGVLDAGENLIGGDDLGGLGAFVADSRIGVARIGDGDVYRLAFLADDDLGRRGLYTMQIDLGPGRNGPFKSSAPSRILAVGDTAWWSAALTSKARPTAKSLMEIGGKQNLPKVGNYFTVGAPMRGASKAWNPLNNNFKPPRQNLWVDFVDKLRKLPSTHG